MIRKALWVACITISTMNRRERWQAVLELEVARWSAKSYEELHSRLSEGQVYEVEFDSLQHQVEVELLENKPDYLHVSISVDDGTLPASLRPATTGFIRRRAPLP
jgi:hypothetical protein